MIPVQTIVPAVLAEIVRKAPLTDEKVAFAWRTAVGPAVAGATDVNLENHTLRVRARDRAWQRELERSAAVVRARLDNLLGAGIVRYIDVTVAASEPRRPAALPNATEPGAEAQAPRNSRSEGGSDTARRRR